MSSIWASNISVASWVASVWKPWQKLVLGLVLSTCIGGAGNGSALTARIFPRPGNVMACRLRWKSNEQNWILRMPGQKCARPLLRDRKRSQTRPPEAKHSCGGNYFITVRAAHVVMTLMAATKCKAKTNTWSEVKRKRGENAKLSGYIDLIFDTSNIDVRFNGIAAPCKRYWTIGWQKRRQ